jgi:hypothetical protein
MRVQTIEHTIRWKGNSIGKPSIIVTVGKDGEEVHFEEILKQIRQFKACSRLIFTGIDPIMEQLEILNIASKLQEGWEVIIETSGGAMPDSDLREKVTAWEVNIPPEGTPLPFEWNEDAVRFYTAQKNSTFEWIVSGEIDLIEVKKIVFKYKIPWKRVILTPYIEALENLHKRFIWLSDFCIMKGCNIGNPIVHLEFRSRSKKDGKNKGHNKRDTKLSAKAPKN